MERSLYAPQDVGSPDPARPGAPSGRGLAGSGAAWASVPGSAAAVGFGGVAALAALAAIRPETTSVVLAALMAATIAACAPALTCARGVLAAGPAARRDAPPPSASPAAAASPAPGPPPPGHERRAVEPPVTRSRRHVRIALRDRRVLVVTEDRRRLVAQVLDVSRSGVALQGNLPGLWVGSMATIGSRRAKAVRALAQGMAFEFSVPISAEDLRPDLVL